MNTIEVLNATEPDQVITFDSDFQQAFFGRDDERCDIVIWSALNDRSLSRVAGRLWRMEGQLWLRNLSLRHELVVVVPGGMRRPPLAPRRDSEDPGEAHCFTAGTSVILGPAGCELLVTQWSLRAVITDPAGGADLTREGERTIDVPDVPAPLRNVALALCEPLLLGAPMPATYRQIAERLGLVSLKRVRTLVSELCLLYADAAAAAYLANGGPRMAQAVSDAGAQVVQITGGIKHFRPRHPDPGNSRPRDHSLALPDYLAVAQMLVRRGMVRTDHLLELEPAPTRRWGPGSATFEDSGNSPASR